MYATNSDTVFLYINSPNRTLGQKLILMEDSTFKFLTRFGLALYTNTGNWKIINDTLILTDFNKTQGLNIKESFNPDIKNGIRKFCFFDSNGEIWKYAKILINNTTEYSSVDSDNCIIIDNLTNPFNSFIVKISLPYNEYHIQEKINNDFEIIIDRSVMPLPCKLFQISKNKLYFIKDGIIITEGYYLELSK